MRYDKAHTPDGAHCPQTTAAIAKPPNPEYVAIPDVPRRINCRCVRSRWCQFPITAIRATVRGKRRNAPHRSPDNPFGRGGKHLLGACRAEQSNAPSQSVPKSRCTFPSAAYRIPHARPAAPPLSLPESTAFRNSQAASLNIIKRRTNYGPPFIILRFPFHALSPSTIPPPPPLHHACPPIPARSPPPQLQNAAPTPYHFLKCLAFSAKFLSSNSGGIPNLENILTAKWRKYACLPKTVPTPTSMMGYSGVMMKREQRRYDHGPIFVRSVAPVAVRGVGGGNRAGRERVA